MEKKVKKFNERILRIISRVLCAAALCVCVAAFLSACNSYVRTTMDYQLDGDLAFGITNLDEVVLSVRNALKMRSRAVHINVKFKGEYMDAISSFVNNLMELVYLPTDDPKEGDYLRFQMSGYTFGYGHKKTDGGFIYSITITPEYYTNLIEEEKTDSEVRQIISKLNLQKDASEADKITAVYDYLCDNVKYDLIHRNNPGYHLKSTAYGALVNHTACCQGYSVAMYRLLKELDVDSRIIIGEGISDKGSELHSWNIIRIGTLYYNVDPTWNRNYTEKDYYLKCNSEFPDHIRNKDYATEEFEREHPMSKESYMVSR